WGELAGFARARRHSTRACLTGAGIPSRRLIAANIEKFTTSEITAAIRAEQKMWSPSPERLDRLLTQIEVTEAQVQHPRGRRQWRSWVWLQGTPRAMQWALAVQAALTVVLTGGMMGSNPGSNPYRAHRYRAHRLHRYAVIAAWALVSGSVGWVSRGEMQSAPVVVEAPSAIRAPSAQIASLPRQAAIAHVVYSPDVRRPVEIGADQKDQLVVWLSNRLGTPLKPPKPGGLGYELIGGRLLPGTSGPVAQFMYHDGTGQRVTLYVAAELTQSKRDTAYRFAQQGPVNVYYWHDWKYGYAVSAGIDKGELLRIATEVHGQVRSIQPPTPSPQAQGHKENKRPFGSRGTVLFS
ncbi:MAG: anti-sigma factor family protein, partial [Nitrospiraceae bacterium]